LELEEPEEHAPRARQAPMRDRVCTGQLVHRSHAAMQSLCDRLDRHVRTTHEKTHPYARITRTPDEPALLQGSSTLRGSGNPADRMIVKPSIHTRVTTPIPRLRCRCRQSATHARR